MLLVPSLGIHEAYAGDERAFTFAIGIFLIAWCFLTVIYLLAALRTSYAVISILCFLTLALFFEAISAFITTSYPGASIAADRVGGVFSVLCAMVAFYAGASGIMSEETTMIRLPLGVIGWSKPESETQA